MSRSQSIILLGSTLGLSERIARSSTTHVLCKNGACQKRVEAKNEVKNAIMLSDGARLIVSWRISNPAPHVIAAFHFWM